VEMATDQPAYGQVRVANELTKRGLFASPTGVRSVWLRHDLETFAKRLKALEAKLAQEPGHVLTESQVRALEKAKQKRKRMARSKRPTQVIWDARYVLCRHDQEHRQDLPADLHRYLHQGCLCQAV